MAKKKKAKAKLELSRRDILTIIAAGAGSVIAAQALTTGPLSPFSQLKQQAIEGEPTESRGHTTIDHQWGMVIDLDKCIGCEYCLRTCTATNDVNPDKPWNIVVEEKSATGHTYYFSRPCLHCQHAPCVEVCPVKATFHRDDGLVVMDYDRCIGCRYCQVACPYDARKFNWQKNDYENPYIPTWGIAEVERRPRGVVEKCTFCIHRIDAGRKNGLVPGEDLDATPACVNICPVGARIFGDLKDENSRISQVIMENAVFTLREELGTLPSVFYIPPKEGV